MLFLEQAVDATLGLRYGRWWAAYGAGGSVTLPIVMVDSGHQISSGYVSFTSVYKSLIDAELPRPAGADLWATGARVGNHVRVTVRFRNQTGATLSSGNGATVHVLAYEDSDAGVTNTMVRAAASTSVSPAVGPGASVVFTLDTADFDPADWSKVHAVALLDYRPVAGQAAYDMAQAARVWFGKPRGDFDGDGLTDVAVYRPSTGTWFSLDSATRNQTYAGRGWGSEAQGDVPVRGDFDGDGVIDPTVFRPGSGTWFVLKSSAAYADWAWFGWGAADDVLVAGDYDGDGSADAAVYRPSTGTWYIRPSSGAAPWNLTFGETGDIPVPGDYDGDTKTDIAVYRPANGTWFVVTSSSGFAGWYFRGWGSQEQSDAPVPGDYDGDGKTDIAVYRPGPGTWLILMSTTNDTALMWDGWGTAADQPVPGDYDGDGRTDAAVYRASTGTWLVKPSGGATPWSTVFGQTGDVPLQGIR